VIQSKGSPRFWSGGARHQPLRPNRTSTGQEEEKGLKKTRREEDFRSDGSGSS
jgi:hypothetical protein